MDPLSLGGEDSLRNAVYCCFQCNGKKKNKPFQRWLAELSEPIRERCRALYILKHEHDPESFEPGDYQLRGAGVPMFLEYDEKEFMRELRGMLPLVREPPAEYLARILLPHPGPVAIESLIHRRRAER
jgi:hypothetical protein